MQGFRKFLLLFFTILFLVVSCSTPHDQPPKGGTFEGIQGNLRQASRIDRNLDRSPLYVPLSVRNALLPPIRHYNKYTVAPVADNRFDVMADGTDARTFFMGLVEGTQYNMVVDPKIAGTITLKLKNVTIDQAMQAVRDVYGYDFRRTSYGYEVFPPTMRSQMYTVNYLDVKRVGKSLTQMTSGEITQSLGMAPGSVLTPGVAPATQTNTQYVPTSSIDTSSEANFWKDLDQTLKSMIGDQDGRSVAVNKQSGIVVVHALPSELRQVARFLDRIQCSMDRQVILEAKILEVQLNDQFQSGINWNLVGKGLVSDPENNIFENNGGANQVSTYTFDNTDLKDFKSMFALNVLGKFGSLIKLLQTQGNVQVLSSPRISTVNNQKAVIKVGDDQFYVTNVSSTTAVSGSSTIPTQSVTLTPFFSGITLDVTPQISEDGTVILHIHPTISKVVTQTQQIVVGSVIGQTSTGTSQAVPNVLSLPLAKSTIRETDDVVRARNGQIVVIGGLMQNLMQETVASTPWAGKIPFLGFLFRRTQQLSQKIELVVLLRPVVVGQQSRAWANDIDQTADNFDAVRRGYHFSSLPVVFGNEAEREEN